MRHGTVVQLERLLPRAKVPGMGVDPLEMAEEETERLALDLPVSGAEFLERYAQYRNALNEAQGRKVKKWSRKSAAEAMLMAQMRQVLDQMAEVFAAHGELPEDDRQMLAYARAVLASSDKPNKKTAK